MIGLILFSLLVTLIVSIIQKWRREIQSMKQKSIKFKQPLPFFGNSLQEVLGMKHMSEVIEDSYKHFSNEDYFGHFMFTSGAIVVRNASIIEQIIVKDFSYFTDRSIPPGPVKEASEATLFNLVGLQWRAARNKFTPLFTSSKLKYMFESLKSCGDSLDEVLESNNGKVLDMGDIMTCYTLDAIGSVAFGFDVNTLKGHDSVFKDTANKLVAGSLSLQLRVMLLLTIPQLFKFLGIPGAFTGSSEAEYFCNIIRQALVQRKKSGHVRPDFIQMLLALKEKGNVEVENHDSADDYLIVDRSVQGQAVELNDDVLIGAAFTFIFAGFHSTAMTMSYALFEMARNPEVLNKAKSELHEVFLNKEFTYDKLKNLKYLENVIKETLRIYPTVGILFRICTKQYTFPDGLVVEPGQRIILPVSALHKDPNYFPEPLVFNPDRFDTNPVPGSFLIFGDGPRMCIGMRLALMEMKYSLAKILLKYDVEAVGEYPPGPLKMLVRAFLTTPTIPIKMRITKR